MALSGRRVVLGVSGGVAAYKSAILARRLLELGADVRIVMTRSAARFLGPPTLAALTGTHPILDLFDQSSSVSPHTDLARWGELMVIAPATTATLSRIASGLSEDALTATVLASRSPLLVAPAMHTEMWEHPATQRNMDILKTDGVAVVGPEFGPLAGGDEGAGRMAEPETIVSAVIAMLEPTMPDRTPTGEMVGTSVLVTAGGTREAIDPVRYLGNRSSGKMGHAIAEEAVRRGATVTLVTTSALASSSDIVRIQVESAQEMEDAVRGLSPQIAVMAAAVADFRPASPGRSKFKRSDGPPQIDLEPTPDILGGLAARDDRPFLVGFAAETGSLERAVEKAQNKGVDLLVANDVTQPEAGFSVDTNRVTIVWPDGTSQPWDVAPKTEVARRLWDLVADIRSR